MILVNYKCAECACTTEHLLTAPAPDSLPCPQCAGEARRRFGIAGLTGRATAPAAGSTQCVDNPGVPGLCHVGPAAKRSLIARHTGDSATLAAEQMRQRRAFETFGPPTASAVFGHTHGAGGHGS